MASSQFSNVYVPSAMLDPEVALIKIILLGDAYVGKTSIIRQYNTHTFDEESEMTIAASFMAKDLETKNGPARVQVWDTAGDERYRSLIPVYTRGAAAALVVVDISNPESVLHQEMWLKTIREHCEVTCIRFLVANKTDLPWTVSKSDLETWCRDNRIRLFCISARSLKDVTSLISEVTEDVIGQQQEKEHFIKLPKQAESRKGCCGT
jgi:small GTP-binding protein